MNLTKLTLQAEAARTDLTPMTVRVREPMRSFIDQFADDYNLSRQEALLELLAAGIEQVEKAVEATTSTASTVKFHVLNTNRAHSSTDQELMLLEGIAAAFFGDVREKINRIKEGDWVFLYQNGRGVIAYGKASGETLKRAHHGQADECYFQELNPFVMLETPIAAKQVKKIVGTDHRFLPALSSLTYGQRLLDTIQSAD